MAAWWGVRELSGLEQLARGVGRLMVSAWAPNPPLMSFGILSEFLTSQSVGDLICRMGEVKHTGPCKDRRHGKHLVQRPERRA